MQVAVFSSKPYDEEFLGAANPSPGHELHHLETRLAGATAALAQGTARCARS